MSISITSTAFREGDIMPVDYTCDGTGISPPLAWHGVPEKTRSLALTCEDPDAGKGIFSHWVIYNLPSQDRNLPENLPAVEITENGAMQGTNDFDKIGYGGPCPGRGIHRYIFTIYALDTELPLKPGADRSRLLQAIEGHILDQSRIMVKYGRA